MDSNLTIIRSECPDTVAWETPFLDGNFLRREIDLLGIAYTEAVSCDVPFSHKGDRSILTSAI